MKKYSEYTTEEIDELYNKLSETAQDFIFSGETKNQVEIIGKKVGLPIDKWEAFDNLTIEAILGICPASLYPSEIESRLGTNKEQTDVIVKHMDSEIFTVIREEEIESSSTEDSHNQSVEAIYDDSQKGLSQDPYREAASSISHGAEVITSEKLHIVDELFSGTHNDHKKTPENIPAPNPLIITKETIEMMDGISTAQKQPVEEKGVTVPKSPSISTPSTVKIESILPTGKVYVRFEKSKTEGKIRMIISRKKVQELEKPEAKVGETKKETVYPKDPYRELL